MPCRLYSYPLLPIVLRELFQNARDACRCVGSEPRIWITVLGDTDFRYGQVVCRDNGCDMDEDTILDRFLCLGGTDKTQDDTGGFGIARAIILGGCTWWEMRTHPPTISGQAPSTGSEIALNTVKGRCLYVSLDHVREQRPVDVVASRQEGSRILLRYDPLPEHDPRYAKLRFQSWHFAQALGQTHLSSAQHLEQVVLIPSSLQALGLGATLGCFLLLQQVQGNVS